MAFTNQDGIAGDVHRGRFGNADGRDRSTRLLDPSAALRKFFSAGSGVVPADAGIGDLKVVLDELIEQGLDRLPLPGLGQTAARWRALAAVAEVSLPLVKLFEGHTDARAICAEFGSNELCATGSWGVWAAQSKSAPLLVSTRAGQTRLSGSKSWCSGATVLTHALVTARSESGENLLVATWLDPEHVSVDTSKWAAVGMRATGTAEVSFRDHAGTILGRPDWYVNISGFWHGAMGIAACWYGATAELARMLKDALLARADDHALAHLGAIAARISGVRSLILDAAHEIDQHPTRGSQALALAVRAEVEECATAVLQRTGRALGALPYCADAHFAALAADLPVFIRQSHAERDLRELGALCLPGPNGWRL